MKLFLLEQNQNSDYDTYDSCVVVAIDAIDAVQITPNRQGWGDTYSAWCAYPSDVTWTYIGEASADLVEGSVICASFNAG